MSTEKSPEHRRKISEALKRYAARPDSHIHLLHGSEEDHPNWKGGVKPDVYRRRAFQAHGKTCNRCGAVPPTYLLAHHIDEDRSNGAIDNLEVLCMSCHLKHHRGKAA